ncbi:MAG: hypothetical protein ABFD79_14710 [Phycisphaerales bacterium]
MRWTLGDEEGFNILQQVDCGEFQITIRKDKYSNFHSIEVWRDIVSEGVAHMELLHDAIFVKTPR